MEHIIRCDYACYAFIIFSLYKSRQRHAYVWYLSEVKQGILPDGSVISVKKIWENSPVPPEKQFHNEVMNLMAIKHENIVKLIGFCYEPQKKVIQRSGRYIHVDVVESYMCYEYVHNGSLGRYISGTSSMHYWIDILVILISLYLSLQILQRNTARKEKIHYFTY